MFLNFFSFFGNSNRQRYQFVESNMANSHMSYHPRLFAPSQTGNALPTGALSHRQMYLH